MFLWPPTRCWHGKGTFYGSFVQPAWNPLDPSHPLIMVRVEAHAQLAPIRSFINAPHSGQVSMFSEGWRCMNSQIANAHSLSAVLPLFQQNHYLQTKCWSDENSHSGTVQTRCKISTAIIIRGKCVRSKNAGDLYKNGNENHSINIYPALEFKVSLIIQSIYFLLRRVSQMATWGQCDTEPESVLHILTSVRQTLV